MFILFLYHLRWKVVGDPRRNLRYNFDIVVRYKIACDIKNFVIEKFNLLGGIEFTKVVYPWKSVTAGHRIIVGTIIIPIINRNKEFISCQ